MLACALLLVVLPIGIYAVAAYCWLATGSGPGLSNIWLDLGVVTLRGWPVWAATGVMLLAGIALFRICLGFLRGDKSKS